MKTYLFITYSDFSQKLTGAHRRFLELVKGISRENKVIVIAKYLPKEVFNENVKWLRLANINESFFPKHIIGMAEMICSLLRYKQELRYDFAISFAPQITICLGWCGYENIISLFRENLIEYQKCIKASKRKIAYFSVLEKIALCYSKKVIVQSTSDKKDLIKRNSFLLKKLKTPIYIQTNNVNASWMESDFVPDDKKEKTVPQVLFIGDFSNCRKGHDVLLPAAAKLLDDGYLFDLYIVGDGKELNDNVVKYKHYTNIHFCGHSNNTKCYFRNSDFEVVPSLIDSCPNTVLEGLAHGIAVYGANRGGIPDLLGEDYLFEPQESSLYLFLKNIIEKKRYLLDSKKQVLEKEKLIFDWSAEIEKIVNG